MSDSPAALATTRKMSLLGLPRELRLQIFSDFLIIASFGTTPRRQAHALSKAIKSVSTLCHDARDEIASLLITLRHYHFADLATFRSLDKRLSENVAKRVETVSTVIPFWMFEFAIAEEAGSGLNLLPHRDGFFDRYSNLTKLDIEIQPPGDRQMGCRGEPILVLEAITHDVLISFWGWCDGTIAKKVIIKSGQVTIAGGSLATIFSLLLKTPVKLRYPVRL